MASSRHFTRSALAFSSAIALWALAGAPSTAAEWVDGRLLSPFICRADFPLGGLEDLFRELRQLHRDLVRQLGLPPASESIQLYLFHDRETYARYLRQYFPDVPYRRALYIKRNGAAVVLAYWSRQFDVDLRHECTHALLHAMLPQIPLWLDEGLAKYFEPPARERACENPQLADLRADLRSGMLPKIENLEKITDLSEMGRLQYRDAWAWVHFMLHGDSLAREELLGYLADLRITPTPRPLSVRLRQRLGDPNQCFTVHFASFQR